jgi:DNA polymerase-3 subunit epsilon
MTHQQDRDNAILECRRIVAGLFICLDTETNRAPRDNPEVVQIALVNECGRVWESFVKPTNPIDDRTSAFHGITNEAVANAPTFLECLHDIGLFSTSSDVVIYNQEFDLSAMQNSLRLLAVDNYKGVLMKHLGSSAVYDAMLLFAQFHGEWDYRHSHYKWFKLGVACQMCNIAPVGQLHGAAVDAEMTRRLVKFMAEQKLSTEERHMIPDGSEED